MPKIIQIEKIKQLTGHRSAIYALNKFSCTDDRFISAAGDGWIVKWRDDDSGTGTVIAKTNENIYSLLFLPESDKIIAGNMNGGVHWIDTKDKKDTSNILHHKKGVFDIKDINGSVYTAGGEGILSKWSKETETRVESYQLSHKSLRAIAYQPSTKEIAIAASDHCIYILDEPTFSLKKKIENAHKNSVFSVAYLNETTLLSGGRDAQLKIWNVAEVYSLQKTIPAHLFTINHMAIHPDRSIFATASRDKTIKIWRSADFSLLKVIDIIKLGGHTNSVNYLLWQNKDRLLSCSDDRTIIIWNIKQFK